MTFELGEPLSDHWIKKLVAELQPDPTELRQYLELDRAEAAEQLERNRIAWELWAVEPIEPFLTIRYMPAVYGVKEVPRTFCPPPARVQKAASGHGKEQRYGRPMNSGDSAPWGI